MINLHEQRFRSASVRSKRSQSAAIQQLEADGKQYRTFLSVFTNHINIIIKCHKDCIGEIENYPKIKTSREENEAVIEHLDKIYPKMEDKIIKDSVSRNAHIKKAISDYTDFYKSSFPQWKETQKTQQNIKNSEIQGDQVPFKNYISQRKQSLSNSSQRPLSSKQTKQTKSIFFHQIYQNFQSTQFSQPYKTKTISGHANENPECKKDFIMANQLKLAKMPSRGKKILLNNKNRYEGWQLQKQKEYDEFLFNGDSIMINQRKCREGKQYDSQSLNTPYSNKSSTKRMINLKFTQRKSIHQIEKMQIQNRIMLINSVLSVNLVRPQGYKPKSRCWQNYFN